MPLFNASSLNPASHAVNAALSGTTWTTPVPCGAAAPSSIATGKAEPTHATAAIRHKLFRKAVPRDRF